jgi:uncharacterized iron-regulated protein
MNAILIFGVLIMSFLTVRAQEIPILDGKQPQSRLQVADIAQKIHPGQIIVMGENHGFKTAQQGQLELMRALRQQGLKVSAGLEFFYYPEQALVDAYREGSLDEKSFLQQIQWGMPPFDFYRDQAVFSRYDLGERTIALNAPRSLTGKISKTGLTSLTSEEQKMLPPDFQLGRDSYKKRFLETMPHLPSPEAGDRYFAAQCTWDDTMAWKAAEFTQAHPDQVLVIVVGDFHVQYGGGLPDRIEARTHQKPVVFSYVNVEGLTAGEIAEQIEPSFEYGPRADYIWFTSEANTTTSN